jgi:type I restriction enzyme M protein
VDYQSHDEACSTPMNPSHSDSLGQDALELVDHFVGWASQVRKEDLLVLIAGTLFARVTAGDRTPRLGSETDALDSHATEHFIRTIERSLVREYRFAPVLDTFVPVLRRTPLPVLASLQRWLSGLDLATREGRIEAARVLDLLVRYMVDWDRLGGVGPFYTPEWIAEFMVALADPRPGETVWDPCFGLGGLLAAASRRLHSGQTRIASPTGNAHVVGTEIDPRAYIVGLARVALEGGDPELVLGDALGHAPQEVARSFDCVLVSPPWGSRSTHLGHAELPIITDLLEGQFLQRALKSLKPGGRAVVAMPEGFLFRSAPDAAIRKWIASEYCLEGILMLPKGAFRPFAGVSGAILVIRNDKPAANVRLMQVPEPRSRKRVNAVADLTLLRSEAAELASLFSSGAPTLVSEVPTSRLVSEPWTVASLRGLELDEFLRELRRLNPEILVQPLAAIASVDRGITYTRNDTNDLPFTDRGPHLIRVADVSQGFVKRPSYRLRVQRAQTVPDQAWVRGGEVLLSISGSIGKVAVTTASDSAAVVSNGVAIIRPHLVSADYLAALLRSPVYSQWLNAHAKGVTIQHLSISSLRDLPIPAPRAPDQARLAQLRHEISRSGPLALARLLAQRDEDSFAHWLTSTPEVAAILEQPLAEVRAREVSTNLERAASALVSYRNQIAHAAGPASLSAEVAQWVLIVGDAARGLRDLNRVPAGPARFALLESARSTLARAQQTMASLTTRDARLASEFTRRLDAFLLAEQELVLGEPSFVGTLDPPFVVSGGSQELVLRVRNRWPMPVRELFVTTRPDFGALRSPYVGEREEVAIPLRLPHVGDDSVSFVATWRVTRLDGRTFNGEIPLVSGTIGR